MGDASIAATIAGIVAVLLGIIGVISLLVTQNGQRKLLLMSQIQLEETDKVHTLVNDRATKQDEKILKLEEKIGTLLELLAAVKKNGEKALTKENI